MERELETASASKNEESRIADTVLAIRKSVAGGPQDGCYPIELGGAKFNLAVAEGDAFRANFAGEDTFRGHLTDVFIDLAAVYGRMLAALEEFKQVQGSTYLWQPKAESLQFLLPRSKESLQRCRAILETATQRGLIEKVAALQSRRDELQQLGHQVQAALDSRKK